MVNRVFLTLVRACKPLEVTPLYETVSELECINNYYYIHFYRIFFSDGLKQSIGNLIPTNVQCIDLPTIPHQSLVQIGMIDTENPFGANSDNQSFVPEYQKLVAKMWVDGLIDDFTYATQLAYQVKTGVIIVDNVQVDSEGVIAVDKNIVIDFWVKIQAGYWVEGKTTDRDYTGAAGFMIEYDVIAFTEKPSRPTTITSSQLSNVSSLDPKIAQLAFETAKQNEVSMKYLQKIKAAEYDLVQNSYDISVNTYSESQDQTSMNNMIGLGHFEKISKELSFSSNQFLKTSVQLAKDAKSDAIRAGVNVLDLEAATVDQQYELDSMSRHFKTESEINSAYKNALKSQRLANTGPKYSYIFNTTQSKLCSIIIL
ncbi:MAG: hypothetical protein HRU07_09135 [Nitrosopumilus sp.]|nr:hypothetical protein [Nitrosopumilus sp.]NRA06293.1 hypothetical protein [Nitrosopumilus sp.]